MRKAFALLVVTGCSYDPRNAAGLAADAAQQDDGQQPDMAMVENCFGVFAEVCLSTLPTDPITFPTEVIDTASPTRCDSGIAEFCVVAGTAITIPVGVTVSATGTRPLVLVATTGAITIDGTLSVASQRPTTIGAGATTAACPAGTDPTGNGGGQGGTLGGRGGDGGVGTTGSVGTAGQPGTISTLRGGCRGINGGNGGGTGGAGGGAVDLIAATIDVTGTINASGMGGSGIAATTGGGGGGGGGSGGMIVFDTPSLTIDPNAEVFANGGGGGEAVSQTAGFAGNPGGDPSSPTAAPGGNGGSNAGDGGDGSEGGVGSDGLEQQCSSPCGGGGGGGGAGVIKTTDPTPPTASAMSPGFS